MSASPSRACTRANPSWLRRIALLCAGLGVAGIERADAAAYWTSSSGSSSMISTGFTIFGSDNITPTGASTYWADRWRVEAWPTPVVTNSTIVAPSASLTVAVQAEAPDAISLKSATGEFYLMDADGKIHAAPVQRPHEWLPINAAAAAAGQTSFVPTYDGVRLVTEDGLVSYEPGPRLFASFVGVPDLSPDDQPTLFVPGGDLIVRPGITFRTDYHHVVNLWTNRHLAPIRGVANTGLTLPRAADEAPDAPLRAHFITKIVKGSQGLFGLGELHPQTPGFAAGTQAIFKSSNGIDWTFQTLPGTSGRWHDLAVSYNPDNYTRTNSPVVGQQIVVVGDGGIYTTRDNGTTWLSVANNLTTSTAPGFTLSLPEGSDAPIDEELPLQLNSIVWKKDRFIAAGRSKTSGGQPVYLEGLSKHWFAYPLQGWPEDRTVDQIEVHQNRILLLGKASASHGVALLAADVQNPVPAGAAPVLTAASHHAPELGKPLGIPINVGTDPIGRFIIEGEDSDGWRINRSANDSPIAYLIPPYTHSRPYHLREEPLKITITAVSPFGRSTPLEVTIAPVIPAPFTESYSSTLDFPSTVNAVFGAAIKIPIKAQKNGKPSCPDIHAFGLPDGLTYDSSESALVGHALVVGTHKIHLLAIEWLSFSSGSSASLAQPLTLVVGAPRNAANDAGTFSGLLTGSENLTGTWTLTVRPDRSFTGTLNLPSGSHPLRGTLSPEEGLSGACSASLSILRKKLPALDLTVILHSADGRVALHASTGSDEATTAGGTVANIPWAKDRLAPRAGDYSAAIRFAPATGATLAGQGFLRMQISTLGKAIVRGELANGIKWTASASLAADGRLPLTAKIASTRSLRGLLAFPADSDTSTALRGELAWRSAVTEKCPAYGEAATLLVAGDATPRAREHRPLLPRGRHELILSHPDLARFGIEHGEVKVPFDTYEENKLTVARLSNDENPLRVSLRLDFATKLASGTFIPAASASRKPSVVLRGAPVTNPDSGETTMAGYFLLPSADGKTLFSGAVSSRFLNN